MPVNDTIADMLTRIRNAGMAKQNKLAMPNTKMIRSCGENITTRRVYSKL